MRTPRSMRARSSSRPARPRSASAARPAVSLLATIVLGVVLTVVGPIGSAPAVARQVASEDGSVTGTFTVKGGDPEPGSGEEHRYVYSVTDDAGQDYRLTIDDGVREAAGGTQNLNRKRVTVAGTIVRPLGAEPSAEPPVIEARSIELVGGAGTKPAPLALSGPQKFATILCRFSDATGVTPKDVSYVNGLLGDSYPGISHFWRENSFNLINNVGGVVKGWYNLPQPRSYYLSPSISFNRLSDDCTAAADPEINFNNYVGINLLFNQVLDCCAWGGTEVITLDGTNMAWPMTFMPPWGYSNQNVLGHEMGHAYGLPHSSGDYGAVYDNGWDVMSGGGDTTGPTDPTYGRVATHTIAYHKDSLGWIPAARKYTAGANSCQVITIDYLSQTPATTGTYLMAQIPIGANHFYTVEARKNFGYDNGRVPGEAVVIHDVLTTREEPAHVMDATLNNNPNDDGAMWVPTEVFNENGVTVAVLAATANGWSVQISSGSGSCGGPPINDPFGSAASLTGSSGAPTGSTSAATKQSGEPNHAGNAGGKSIWYTFTPSLSGTINLNTFTSSFDTLLAVYTGSAVNALTVVAANDNSGGAQSSIASMPVNGGTKYSIAIDGFGGSSGSTKLTWSYAPTPPANDNFASATVLTGTSGSPAGSTATATKEAGEPSVAGDPGGKSIWYTFTPPSDGTLSADTYTSSFDTLLGLYKGPAVSSLTLVASNDDSNSTLQSAVGPSAVTGGTNYSIVIDGWSGASGSTVLHWSFTPTVPPGGGGRYTPLTPARILDTRDGTGGLSGPVASGATVEVQITGRGGVPATGVAAVAVNVTVTQPTGSGFLTLYPAGSALPLAANLNFTPAKTVPNLVVVKLGTGGRVAMLNSAGSTHVIYDVAGWYSESGSGNAGRYSALVPARLLDTRGGLYLGPGASLDLQVSGQGGVPASGAAAAVLNVAATATTATSFLTVYPTGEPRPLAANVNFTAGDTVSNRAMAKLGTGGKVTIYNSSGTTDVIVDVGGWFSDASVAGTTGAYTALVPARILDTRDGTGGISGPIGGGANVDVQVTGQGGVPASGVSAVILNATVVGPTAGGWITVSPTGTPLPLASDLNYATGETRPNLVVARVGTGGKVNLFTSAGTHVVFDVAGWVS